MRYAARRKGESGQALVELAISLIAIMSVFLAVLAISALGIENIGNTLTTRANADNSAANSSSGSAGNSIIQWNLGDDKMLMTFDDSYAQGGEPNANDFTGELTITRSGDTGIIGSSINPTGEVFTRSFPESLDTGNLFISAAGLVSSTTTENNPLEKRNLTGLSSSIRTLLGGNSFTITDTIYMPAIASE